MAVVAAVSQNVNLGGGDDDGQAVRTGRDVD